MTLILSICAKKSWDIRVEVCAWHSLVWTISGGFPYASKEAFLRVGPLFPLLDYLCIHVTLYGKGYLHNPLIHIILWSIFSHQYPLRSLRVQVHLLHRRSAAASLSTGELQSSLLDNFLLPSILDKLSLEGSLALLPKSLSSRPSARNHVPPRGPAFAQCISVEYGLHRWRRELTLCMKLEIQFVCLLFWKMSLAVLVKLL